MTGIFGHDIIEMVTNAGFMAKSVLFILLVFSVISWAIIFMKLRILHKMRSETEKFLEYFWREDDLESLYPISKGMEYSPIVWIFKEGYEELGKIKSLYNEKREIIEDLERSLKKVLIDQTDQLGYGLGFLATTGNTAPFIGLFGTVWGIMEAFRGIGIKGSASLAVVAPGISEALITTAAGLAVAVPATVAFNYFSTKISSMRSEMEVFISDFIKFAIRELERNEQQ